MTASFLDLGVTERVAGILESRGISAPTPVQAQVFAPVAEGRDLLARSRTGSGKTLAFGLPLIGRLDAKVRAAQMLVLTPTRELATQVARELEDVAKAQGLSVVAVIGGASMRDQVRGLKTSQVVVGTPGRLLDHLQRGTLRLDEARAIVLDEGDEMLDMGFLEDIETILKQFPDEGQRLLFSATVPPEMKRVIANYLREPVVIETESKSAPHAHIRHDFYHVRPDQRYAALVNFLLSETITSVMVFTRTKQESQEVALRLVQDGFSASFLNGDLGQDQRNQVMEAFRTGATKLLIATDVAARGIDVQGVSHVVHYSLPSSFENYVHRSGRTGRAGAVGVSVAIVAGGERAKAVRFARIGNLEAEWKPVPDPGVIAKVRYERLRTSLLERAQGEAAKSSQKMAKKLLAEVEAPALVAALIDALQEGSHAGYAVDVPPERPLRRERPDGARKAGKRAYDAWDAADRTPSKRESGMERFRIAVGHRQRLSPGILIQVLCRETGLKGSDFGRIDIQTNYTLFDVRAVASTKLKAGRLKFDGKAVTVQPV